MSIPQGTNILEKKFLSKRTELEREIREGERKRERNVSF
jgi:hypothetical protein